MTEERVRRATELVRTGKRFALNALLDAYDPPPFPRRGAPRHTVMRRATGSFDDVIDNFYPQTSSRWDALSHVGDGYDHYYNGATANEVIIAGVRNGIDHWARIGIIGRAVLLDVEQALAADGRAFEPGTAAEFTVDDLELVRKHTGVEYEPADILMFNTGFGRWYEGLSSAERTGLPGQFSTRGIIANEDMYHYLWNSGMSAIAMDTLAAEAWHAGVTPVPGALNFLHRMLIGQFGIALGELWWLADLADDCAADGVYAAMFVSAPLNARGGVGSPPNAIAIK